MLCGNSLYVIFLKELGHCLCMFCFIIFVAQLHLCFVTIHQLFVLPLHFLLKALLVCVLCQHNYIVCVFILHCMCKHYPSYFLALVACVMVICIFILHCGHKHYISYFDRHHISYFNYVCLSGLFSIFCGLLQCFCFLLYAFHFLFLVVWFPLSKNFSLVFW
jgi:hypothetical protein